MKTDVLVRACRENPALLQSIHDWLEGIREDLMRQLVMEDDEHKFLRIQGATRAIPTLKARLEKLVAKKPT